jgi:glycosyltransferase involved in cell wall biosynthesis
MVRVGLFTESYDPVINGVSTSVKTLAMELARAGHEPVIVAPRFPGFADTPASQDGITVVRIPSWTSVFNPQNPFAYPPVFGIPAVLRTARFDVVHSQQPFGMGRHGRGCARRLGVPLVSTFHTLYTEYAHYFPVVPRSTALQWIGAQLRNYYETCDAVIVPSHAAQSLLESLGIAVQRLAVVPTGVPAAPVVVPAAVERARSLYSLPPRAPLLLYVGRLAREKNLDLLLDAFGRLCAGAWRAGEPSEHPILLLVGSGPYQQACIDKVRRAGLEPWVRFAGFLRRTDLAPIYALATLFVFPSTTETQGVSLSEAQSHGVPCIAVHGGGASEFVRDGVDALVVAPGIDSLAGAIEQLLADAPRRQAFRQAAMQSPLRPLPTDMARLLLGIYEDLRAGRSGADMSARCEEEPSQIPRQDQR